MGYAIGIIVSLLGGLFYFKTKAKSAESLNENVETKNKINELSGETEKLAARNDVEQERRKAIQDHTEEATKGVDTNEDLIKFIDSYTKRKS